ncbi:MAG: hypothetical protein EXS64_12090 [Candidatus Latescibacteria bacterium]|nr:hypothetical protein [Candidatus Latescibacterota bacterium]
MKSFLALCALVALTASALHAAEPPPGAKAASGKLLSALVNGDFAAFLADGEPPFKALPRERFDAVVAQLSPRFKAGYTVAYLGELKQKGYQVTLWKLSFKDNGDDALATLSLKDGKVGGFWIK